LSDKAAPLRNQQAMWQIPKIWRITSVGASTWRARD